MNIFNSKIRLASGVINSIHGLLHLLQVLISILFVFDFDHETMHMLFDNPIMAIFWGIFGIISLVIGVADYKHHKKCKNNGNKQ